MLWGFHGVCSIKHISHYYYIVINTYVACGWIFVVFYSITIVGQNDWFLHQNSEELVIIDIQPTVVEKSVLIIVDSR